MKEKIEELVREFIAADEAYDDNAQIALRRSDGDMQLLNSDEAEELDDEYDIISAMDLVRMDAEGNWVPDTDAIADFLS